MDFRLITFIAALMLSGCAAVQGVTRPPEISSKTALNQLAPQDLKRGDCAMFVWERAAPNRFILFTRAQTQSGVWYDGAQSRAVTITSEAGEQSQRQSPAQDLSAGDKILGLSLSGAQAITDGTRYKEGVLRVSGGPDWDRVIPVVGLSSCGR